MSASTAAGPAGRRVLLVEDEPLLRDFLADLLRDAGYVVRACATAEDAIREFAAFDPDAILSDIDLGGGASGVDLAISLVRRAPYLRVIFLSSYSIPPDYRNPEIARAAHINKRDITGSAELLTIIDSAFRGKPVSSGTRDSGALAKLTPTQASVLRLIAAGASNEEIAAQRGSTVGAVEHIITRIFTGLGIKSDTAINMRVAAVKMYYETAGRPGSDESLEPPHAD